nr:hypothetical protein [uncultured Carboxylicivirga sp.]
MKNKYNTSGIRSTLHIFKKSNVKIQLLLVAFLIGIISFSSCQKDAVEQPGNIPGMGNTEGELQTKAYSFHQDLTFGDMTGVSKFSTSSLLKSTSDLIIVGSAQGSGDQVMIELTITNTNKEECRSAWFRAGTVFVVNLDGYQNAILLSPVNVCVPPNTTKTFVLYLYCLNNGMEGSDPSASYELLGVTTSPAMLYLVNLLQFKMVNYEHYVAYPKEGYNYETIKDKLQEMVWKITNGTGLTPDDLAFIEDLPDLPTGVLPEYIYNLEVPLPDCWCLDECSVVGNSGALSYIMFKLDCDNIEDYEGAYTDNGFEYKVLVENGGIKFESTSEPALGEDGRIEIGTFTFTMPCYDEDIEITVKNKTPVTQTINITQVGQSILMTNGFMVEFISVDGNDEIGFTYVFNIVSDSCTGGETNTNK